MKCDHFLSYLQKNTYFGFLAAGNCIFYIKSKNPIFGAKLSTFTLWCQIVHGAKLAAVPNCPRCQIVHFYTMVPNCPGAKLSAVPNCLRCQIVRGAKLSTFTLWCQIVRQHGRCQIVRGAKLSWCQIVLGPFKMHELLLHANAFVWIICLDIVFNVFRSS